MQTKYFKGFAITNELVSIEELRSIAQMQAKMDELVRYRPIQYLTDGYDFSMEEAGDPEIHFSDILWGEGIDAEHSCLHMKDGRTVALPFGTRGLEILFRESKEKHFTQISYYVFLSIPSIEKISRKAVYLKGCDIRFKVSRTYFPLLQMELRNGESRIMCNGRIVSLGCSSEGDNYYDVLRCLNSQVLWEQFGNI